VEMQSADMGRKPAKSRGAGLGGTLILMVFVVVCLAVFSALSFVTARADLALSEKNTMALEAYYTADAAAQAKLAQIDDCLVQAAGKSGNYAANCAALLTELPDLVYQAGSGIQPDKVAFEMKVDDVRTLYVELALKSQAEINLAKIANELRSYIGVSSGTTSDAIRYTITAYKTVNNSTWETTSRIEVWPGQ